METKIERRLGKASKAEVWIVCPECKVGRWLREDSAKRKHFTGCCVKCWAKNHLGHREHEHHQSWKGGRRKTSDGYITVQLAKADFFRPMATPRGVVREHRLVMAKHLNRCLLSWEIVHHRNGIKDDNRLENLELLPSRNYHLVDSVTKALIKSLERTIRKQTGIIEKLKEQLGKTITEGAHHNAGQ